MITRQSAGEERAFTRSAFQKLGGVEGLLERFLTRALDARETPPRRQAATKALLALTDSEIMNIDEAIQRFRTAAIQKGDFAQPAAEDHRLHREMATAWRELHNQGIAGRDAFKKLLADESKYVRGWVAAQLLSEGEGSS